MDELWLTAPAPAVKVWREPARQVAWRLNGPAVAWSHAAGVGDAAWLAFGRERLDDTERGGRGRVGAVDVGWTSCALEPGLLVWLAPGPWPDPQPAFGSPAERLEMLQEFGRIGMFERHFAGGEGHWDRHMFRLFGFDPAAGTPSFEAASERVHPEDRTKVLEWHQRYAREPGRHEARYRLLLPDGQVRDIHSQLEVRLGTDGKPATVVGVVIDDTESAGRLRAQMALAAKLARAIELARVSVWHYDLALGRFQFNAAGYRAMGEPPDSVGMGVDAVRATIHPDDRDAVVHAAQEAMRRHDVVDVEARYRNPDGSWRHLLTRRVAERDEQQRVVALAGVSIDQTERMAERERVRALHRRLELVTAAAGLGLWSADIERGQVEWNAQMAELYGLDADAPAPTLRRWIGVHVHRDDRRCLVGQWRRAIAGGDAGVDIDFRIVRRDGGVRWVACRARLEVRDDGRRWLVGIHLDISERRATEAELRRQQERLAMATRAAGAGVWEREVDGAWLYWSEQMYRLRGLSPDDPRPLDEVIASIFEPAQREHLRQLTRRHIDEGVPYEAELRVVWPDGSVHWIATAGQVVRDEQGRPLRMMGVNWDITQHKRAEAALRDKEAAERASRAKSEFLARMSHELRTPLNAVIGFAQLIEHDAAAPLAPVQRERVAHIRAAGAHLLALIEDVLDLAAIESATLPIALEPVSVDAALDDVQQWVAPLGARGGVTLHLARSGRWVVADARRLRQVLANLLTNAIKYNRAGGAVWVDVATSPDDPAGETTCITVRDDGRGMSAAQVEHLFEPFNRLGAERDGIEGVGIGLMIVRHLVQFMGGRVDVSSAPGQGSTFRIGLKGAAATPSSAGVAPATTPLPPERVRDRLDVLYIEDNPVNVLLVEEMVALRSHVALRCAADGASGVAAAIASPPEVVLVDMQLPDMDGFEVLRRLRAEPALAGTVLVALSANAMPEDVARARAAGFDDYWTKPIEVDRFLGGLDALSYGARRSRTQAPASSR